MPASEVLALAFFLDISDYHDVCYRNPTCGDQIQISSSGIRQQNGVVPAPEAKRNLKKKLLKTIFVPEFLFSGNLEIFILCFNLTNRHFGCKLPDICLFFFQAFRNERCIRISGNKNHRKRIEQKWFFLAYLRKLKNGKNRYSPRLQ